MQELVKSGTIILDEQGNKIIDYREDLEAELVQQDSPLQTEQEMEDAHWAGSFEDAAEAAEEFAKRSEEEKLNEQVRKLTTQSAGHQKALSKKDLKVQSLKRQAEQQGAAARRDTEKAVKRTEERGNRKLAEIGEVVAKLQTRLEKLETATRNAIAKATKAAETVNQRLTSVEKSEAMVDWGNKGIRRAVSQHGTDIQELFGQTESLRTATESLESKEARREAIRMHREERVKAEADRKAREDEIFGESDDPDAGRSQQIDQDSNQENTETAVPTLGARGSTEDSPLEAAIPASHKEDPMAGWVEFLETKGVKGASLDGFSKKDRIAYRTCYVKWLYEEKGKRAIQHIRLMFKKRGWHKERDLWANPAVLEAVEGTRYHPSMIIDLVSSLVILEARFRSRLKASTTTLKSMGSS